MGLFDWAGKLFFHSSSSDLRGNAAVNQKLNDQTDALQGGSSQLTNAAKYFYTQMIKDIRSSKNALKEMRRLKENVKMHYQDLEHTMAGRGDKNPDRTAKKRLQFETVTNADLKAYLQAYFSFIQTTDNILLKQKYMVGYEDRFLEELFLDLRNEIRRDISTRRPIMINPRHLSYLKDALTRLFYEERSKVVAETLEDNRFYHTGKVRVGLLESFLGESHFVNKAKRDLKRWNRQETSDLRLDREISLLIRQGQVERAMPLIETHVARVRESSQDLAKLSKDEQIAMEEAIRLSDEVMIYVRASGSEKYLFSPDPTVKARLEECHNLARKSLDKDLQDSKRLSDSLGIMQANLIRCLDEIGDLVQHAQGLAALQGMQRRVVV